jgi:hypothetical protein
MYIGGAAMLLWGILLNRNATALTSSLPNHNGLGGGNGEATWRKLLGKIAFWMLLAGPSGALAVLLWERDMIVRQKTKQGL